MLTIMESWRSSWRSAYAAFLSDQKPQTQSSMYF